MSYHIPDKASIESLIDYMAHAAAALASFDETAALVAPWKELTTKLRAARDERDNDSWSYLGASARVGAWDARWDASVTTISGLAYAAAGKDVTSEPYVSLFGNVRAADATRMGAYKATMFGSKLLAKAKEQNHPALRDATAQFAPINAALEKAAHARRDAAEKMAVHDVKRYKLIDEIEQLIAKTEIGVLTAFPGQRKIVQAMFSWALHMAKAPTREQDENTAQPATVATTAPAEATIND